MTANVEAPPVLAGPLYMDAVLQPNRSLGRRAFVVLMIVAGTVAGAAAIFYAAMGAWPIAGFFGLDILLLWAAFHLSYRQGRMHERVRVSAERLHVERRHPTGRAQHWCLPPQWAYVRMDEPAQHDSHVEVTSRGERLILGAFLAPEERGDFAAALKTALDAARGARHPSTQGSGGGA